MSSEIVNLTYATRVLARLDAWLASNKAHSVVIDNENGYGATCWRIRLLRVGTGIPTREVIGQEVQFTPQSCSEGITVYASQEDTPKADWPGLIPTIEVALDKWEENANEL